jgi:hypothetical protein
VGGLRAVLWQWAGGGLRLPQDKAPSTVARRVIHIRPESYCQGSGSFVLRGGGGSQEWAVALLSVLTRSKNPLFWYTSTLCEKAAITARLRRHI